MHSACNKQRGGQIYGFPLFSCKCHLLKIAHMSKGYILFLHYLPEEIRYPVSSAKHMFVFPDRSWGHISAVWSMGTVGPGKKGITGKGNLGHALPRIPPDEVDEFNRLEIERVQGSAIETIEKYNERMDPMLMQVHFSVVDDQGQ